MRCPFLREEQVKSCQAAPFRVSLARPTASVDAERCTSPAYAGCAMLRESHEAHPNPLRCPFLRESLAQFCAMAPAASYVPWSASPELRCAHDGHRFCSVFLETSGPEGRRPARVPANAAEAKTALVLGVPVPGWLLFADSHLWLDIGDDGVGHVGMDAFLAQLLGTVERLDFTSTRGTSAPAVTVTVRGAALTLRFPVALRIVAANTRLRASLDRLAADPYGLGWLFEVRLSEAQAKGAAGLRRGTEAHEWMSAEVRRVSERVHAQLARGELHLAADGGRFAPGLLDRLEPSQVSQVLSDLVKGEDVRRTP